MSVTTIQYLDRNGEIAVYSKGTEVSDDGVETVYFESGDAPQAGATILDPEAIARIFRQHALDAEAAHEASQKAAKAARKDAIAEHAAKVATLTEAGLPQAAIDIIVGSAPEAYTAKPFIPKGAAENLRQFGLNTEQINRVLGGWV